MTRKAVHVPVADWPRHRGLRRSILRAATTYPDNAHAGLSPQPSTRVRPQARIFLDSRSAQVDTEYMADTLSRHPEIPGQQPDAEQNGQQAAPPDGQHTAPAPAVRARPWIPRLPAPARMDA